MTTDTLLLLGYPVAMLAGYLVRRNDRYLHGFIAAAVTVPAVLVADKAFSAFCGLSTMRYDEYFYWLDQAFGCPGYMLGRVLNAHVWLKKLVMLDYQMFIAAALGAILLTFLLRGAAEGYRAFGAVLAAFALAPVFYHLLPASGPAFAFQGFPFTEPGITSAHVLSLTAPPNCFPSDHLAAALFCLFLVRRWPVARIFAGVHVGLTILATLGLGEHYAIDLIAAVPYTAVILWVFGLVRQGDDVPAAYSEQEGQQACPEHVLAES